ncbi:MAG: valine--tRNA ligase [Candidatus Berkiellales bacterium]
MEKIYQPHELEKKWYQHWEENGFFKPKEARVSYCIMLPPPNVTGTLHMGHAFQDSLMDALIRYHRMMGNETLWQGGTDHAGIATQMVVERQLLKQNISKKSLGREAFVKKVWEWKEQSGDTISRQMRRLGSSVDWTRERFTMDEGLSHAVKEVFVKLYDEGLIYRGKRLVNWDPKLQTAVSDLEVIQEEEDGFLWHIRYPIVGSKEYLVVATTRPETMLGDAAVAVHPEDERYEHLIGKMVALPLCDREIPIIADDFVDREFGTGCVKITPAHDFNDHEVAKRHHLPMINIFTLEAILNNNVPKKYQGLDRFDARKQIVKDLEAASLIEKIEPHRLKVPRGDRSSEIVEPLLTDQWFVNTQPLAKAAIAAVKSGKIEFVPENWSKTYFEWMNNIQDWCISRQLWWGHQIPAWYDDKGNVYVGHSEAEVRSKYKLNKETPLTQDPDVLDTWFSAALWPFSTLGWPTQTPELKTFYPTNVLVTGFDIIFFWVARMIMMGLKFTGDVPFKQVYIHGLILDAHGQKMSKSKGNILDPIDLIDGIDLDSLVEKRIFGLMQPSMAKQIEKQTRKEFPDGIPSFGTDALRFTFCALASTSRHIRFDLARVEGNRNFCNKLWNASRYVLMNLEGKEIGQSNNDREFSVSDRWIWSLWQKTKKTIHDHLATYRFDIVAQTLYDFVWSHYCDWYLELSKPILTGGESSAALCRGTRYTLIAILEELLRAIHPLMPFISEEIWQKLLPLLNLPASSIMIQPYPLVDASKEDPKAEQTIAWIQAFVMGVRNIRGEMNVNPGELLPVFCQGGSKELQAAIKASTPTLMALAKLENLEWAEPTSECATALVEDLEIKIPLSGLINKEAELKRLTKEMEKLEKDILICEQKLNNKDYIQKAPKAVVEKDRERLQAAKLAQEKISENYEKIKAL